MGDEAKQTFHQYFFLFLATMAFLIRPDPENCPFLHETNTAAQQQQEIRLTITGGPNLFGFWCRF